jgi:dipeptidyl aminopeptidase/acylaminoacyl peptidase
MSGIKLAAALAVFLSAGAVAAEAPADAALQSPDGLVRVWAPAGCHCLWGQFRGAADAPWSLPREVFEVRGAVGKIVFSPDSKHIAFENPRGDWTVEAPRGDPSMQGLSPPKFYGWGFIGVFDLGSNRISFVDPSFASDADPAWSADGRSISFTRHAENAADQRLTRPLAPDAGTVALAPGSAAAFLSAPIAQQPAASADGKVVAYVTREGAARAIYAASAGAPSRRIFRYADDDGQELDGVALSPSGDLVAWVRGGRPNKLQDVPNPRSEAKKPVDEIWLAGVEAGREAHVVANGEAPTFVSGGDMLVWMSDEGLKIAQVIRNAPGGPRLRSPSLMIPGAVRAFRFSPDGKKLAYERGDRVFVYDLATDRTFRIERPDGVIDTAAAWAPDGKRLAFIRANQTRGTGYELGYNGPFESKRPWSIAVVDAATGQMREIWQAKAGRGSTFYPLDQDPTATGHEADQLLWTAGDRIAFPWEGDGWRHLWSVPAAGGEPQLLTPGDGEVETAAVSADGAQIVVATNIGDLGRRHLAAVDTASGAMTPLTAGKMDQWGPTALSGGGLAYIEAGAAEPPTIRIRIAEGKVLAADQPQPPAAFPAGRYVEPRLIELKASDGGVAYGQLFVPKRPTGCGVVFAHGGIKRQMLPGFHYLPVYSHLYEVNQYLVSRGCTVLSIEYRSSIMRGYAFRNAPGWGSAGASEMLDVEAAGRYLLAHKELKVRRVGIWGLSWGGYITAQALARYQDLFAAGFDVAGVHEFFGDRVKNSPEALIAKWRSPVLLVQADDDRNVDFYQGLSLAALLRKQGVKAEFRVLPDEVHDAALTFEDLVSVYGGGADYLVRELGRRR